MPNCPRTSSTRNDGIPPPSVFQHIDLLRQSWGMGVLRLDESASAALTCCMATGWQAGLFWTYESRGPFVCTLCNYHDTCCL